MQFTFFGPKIHVSELWYIKYVNTTTTTTTTTTQSIILHIRLRSLQLNAVWQLSMDICSMDSTRQFLEHQDKNFIKHIIRSENVIEAECNVATQYRYPYLQSSHSVH
jgi:hypothetical protein